MGVFDDAYDARIAGQTADGLWGEIRAVMQMAAALAVKFNQRFRGTCARQSLVDEDAL